MDTEMLQVMEWHNGERGWTPFSNDEFASRHRAMRKHMAERNIEACIFTSYHNICYFSGFLYCAFGRRYGLVITHDDVTTVTSAIDGGQPWRRGSVGNITYTDWQRDNFFLACKNLLGKVKRVGVEYDQIPVAFLNELERYFPEIVFVDISDDVMWMRTIKSPEEQVLIRHGAQIANIGGQAVMDAVRAGVCEHEVAISGTNAMIRAIADTFPDVELRDTWTWFQSGINTDGAHNPVTNKLVERGDILSLNCFPMIHGYYTALERTLFCDQVSEAHLKYWQKNCEVMDRGSALIGPGRTCSEIAMDLNEIYRSSQLLKFRSFGYGHSFGVLSHYYGREAGVELREDVHTVLQPGMVVSMEPMIMIPEGEAGAGGYREHDIFIVTDTGAENITNFPYGPEHMIVGV